MYEADEDSLSEIALSGASKLASTYFTLFYRRVHVLYTGIWLVGWLCLTSHQQRGHLETAPPFTVPCKGHEAR